jgi:hypothetical protein
LVREGEKRGFDVEVYHCGFDPDSLDMVIVRELGSVVLDSTAPHEYFPHRKGDEIVDLYDAYIKPGTDERYEKELQKISALYKDKMRSATEFFNQAYETQGALNDLYEDVTDKTAIFEIKKDLSIHILKR